SGAGLAGANHFTLVERCIFVNCRMGVSATNAAYWAVRNCFFMDCDTAIFSQCSSNPDNGDNAIDGNTIVGGTTGMLLTTSGHRVTNNKVMSSRYGILVQPSFAFGVDGEPFPTVDQ